MQVTKVYIKKKKHYIRGQEFGVRARKSGKHEWKTLVEKRRGEGKRPKQQTKARSCV